MILHIDTGAEMRGGQWQALYLIRELARRGHGVRLLARPGSPLLKAAVEERIGARPLRLSLLHRAAAEADLIHAHDARAHTLAVLTRKPVVVSRRVAFAVGRGALTRWKYRRAAHYIAVSEYVKRTLVEAGVEPDKITVVYDGVPLNTAPPLTLRDRSRVIALDSEDPGKGRKIVERAAALANIPVHFSSKLPSDLPAGAFVYITELEGLGSAALLAMALGTPVLASRVGGLPEIVEDGVTGLLTSNEPEQIAKNMQRLLSDRQLAARLAVSARTRVEREFSIERMVNGAVRVYERILN
ncbi:MAG TPA: glycosyltransferase family 4 protein [Bryobacteraceae bacterium]|nr:glycosyltransferase family 4 protein [Bryobacteraceae bacterium]